MEARSDTKLNNVNVNNEDFLCPITLAPMDIPVQIADDKRYEAAAIIEWLAKHNTSPLTRKIVPKGIYFDEQFYLLACEQQNKKSDIAKVKETLETLIKPAGFTLVAKKEDLSLLPLPQAPAETHINLHDMDEEPEAAPEDRGACYYNPCYAFSYGFAMAIVHYSFSPFDINNMDTKDNSASHYFFPQLVASIILGGLGSAASKCVSEKTSYAPLTVCTLTTVANSALSAFTTVPTVLAPLITTAGVTIGTAASNALGRLSFWRNNNNEQQAQPQAEEERRHIYLSFPRH